LASQRNLDGKKEGVAKQINRKADRLVIAMAT
jgi:hypothetical protein